MFTQTHQKDFNLENAKRIIDIKDMVKSLTKNTEQTVFDIIRLKMIMQMKGSTLVCGFNLDQSDLLQPLIKTKSLNLVNIILDELEEKYPELKEVQILKRKIQIALDKAYVSFTVVFEFSRLSTTVSYISTPLPEEEQLNVHIDRTQNDVVVLSAIVDSFLDCNFINLIYNTRNTKSPRYDASSFFGDVDFDLFLEQVYSRKVDAIDYLIFNLSKDPIVKSLQVDYVVTKLKTFIPESEMKQDYEELKIVIRAPDLMFGVRVELS